MSKGQKRTSIMDLCPEGFEDELGSFIDDIESEVVNIVSELNINNISDIGNIEDAYRLADKLADDLW